MSGAGDDQIEGEGGGGNAALRGGSGKDVVSRGNVLVHTEDAWEHKYGRDECAHLHRERST